MKTLLIAGISLCSLLITKVAICQTKDEESISTLFNAVKSETSPVEMESLINKMIKLQEDGDDRNGFLIEYSKGVTAIAYAEDDKLVRAKYWLDKIEDKEAKKNTVYTIVQKLIATRKLDEAEQLLEPSITSLFKDASSPSPGTLPGPSLKYFKGLQGAILFYRGKFKESLPYLAASAFDRSPTNDIYALALAKVDSTSKAIEITRNVLSQPGTKSTEFMSGAKVLFKKVYGNDRYFGGLLDSLATVADAQLNKKIQDMVVNQAAPDFTITGIDGRQVSLASLHGKTVILDFWATWCTPCVGSLPGMQKAVNYYRNDTSVVFMFIHTSERSATPTADAIRLLKQKKFDIPLYMDLKDEHTKENTIARNFRISALPTKLLIDPNGMIRFKNTGYVSEDEAVPEIRKMVEMSRKAHN